MAGWGADLVLVLGPVNVNEAVASIRVVIVHAVQPKNSRHHQVVGGGQRVFRPEGHSAAKNRSTRHVAADLLGDPEIAGRRLETAFLGPNAKPRCGNWIGADSFTVASKRKLLVADRNIDGGAWTLRRRSRVLRGRCAFIYAALHEFRLALQFDRS